MNKSELTTLQKRVFERLARMLGALSSPARLVFLQILAQSPQTVEVLAAMSGLTVANTSQHLQKMAREGLVEVERQGINRIYRLRVPSLVPVWEEFQDLARVMDPWLREAESQLSDGTQRSGTTLPEIKKELRAGKALLLDVRTEREALATPIPGALNIPEDRLKSHAKRLPLKKLIYVTCRGRYCPGATQAVNYLRSRGFKVFRVPESPFRLRQALI